jgi:hypothetical protein
MRDLAGPAVVEGQLRTGERQIEFRERATGRAVQVSADPTTARFRALLPEGEYTLSSGGVNRSVTLLPGSSQTLDLRPENWLSFQLSSKTAADGTVSLEAAVEGSGRHVLSLRADNVAFQPIERQVELKPGTPQTLVWTAKPALPDAPWVVVVYADGDLSQRREATGPVRNEAAQR